MCSWYLKAQEYIAGTDIEVAFVSTNSITQGEQVGILWEYLLNAGTRINFAHRTFDWSNQARGNAAVFVVIIGFATFDRKNKQLFDYPDPLSEPVELPAKNINPYLVDGELMVITSRKRPISDVPPITFGNKPVDGQFLLLTDAEKEEYLAREPEGAEVYTPTC